MFLYAVIGMTLFKIVSLRLSTKQWTNRGEFDCEKLNFLKRSPDNTEKLHYNINRVQNENRLLLVNSSLYKTSAVLVLFSFLCVLSLPICIK